MTGFRFFAAFSLCLALLVPARGANLKMDLSLIRDDGESSESVAYPYLAHFSKDGLNVYYVAAAHAQSGPTLELIRGVLRDRKIGLAIVEGMEGSPFARPRAFAKLARADCGDDFCRDGEPVYAAMLAAEKGIPILGGEPPQERMTEAALADGYTREDLMAYAFFRWLPVYQRQGRLTTAALPALFEENRGERRLVAGDEEVERFTYKRFLLWYEEKNGKPLDPEHFDSQEDAPKSGGRYFTQRLSSATERPRTRFFMRLLARQLPRYRDVLIVYGGSHFAVEREALESMLDRPVVHFPKTTVASRE